MRLATAFVLCSLTLLSLINIYCKEDIKNYAKWVFSNVVVRCGGEEKFLSKFPGL
jgi:hypothetical protein